VGEIKGAERLPSLPSSRIILTLPDYDNEFRKDPAFEVNKDVRYVE
jgi:hypothetical protein